MRLAEQILIGVGAMALVASIVTVTAPKTVQAAVAALIRDVDNPGRATIAFAQCGRATDDTGGFSCSPTYTVPAGYRLVVEQVEGSCLTRVGQGVSAAYLQVVQSGSNGYHAIPLLGGVPITSQSIIYSANLPVRYYADPGSGFTFTAIASNQYKHNNSCTLVLNEYLISHPSIGTTTELLAPDIGGQAQDTGFVPATIWRTQVLVERKSCRGETVCKS